MFALVGTPKMDRDSGVKFSYDDAITRGWGMRTGVISRLNANHDSPAGEAAWAGSVSEASVCRPSVSVRRKQRNPVKPSHRKLGGEERSTLQRGRHETGPTHPRSRHILETDPLYPQKRLCLDVTRNPADVSSLSDNNPGISMEDIVHCQSGVDWDLRCIRVPRNGAVLAGFVQEPTALYEVYARPVTICDGRIYPGANGSCFCGYPCGDSLRHQRESCDFSLNSSVSDSLIAWMYASISKAADHKRCAKTVNQSRRSGAALSDGFKAGSEMNKKYRTSGTSLPDARLPIQRPTHADMSARENDRVWDSRSQTGIEGLCPASGMALDPLSCLSRKHDPPCTLIEDDFTSPTPGVRGIRCVHSNECHLKEQGAYLTCTPLASCTTPLASHTSSLASQTTPLASHTSPLASHTTTPASQTTPPASWTTPRPKCLLSDSGVWRYGVSDLTQSAPPRLPNRGRVGRRVWKSSTSDEPPCFGEAAVISCRGPLPSVIVSSMAAGDLAVQPGYCDDDDASETVSIGAESQSSSECGNKATTREEVFDEEGTFAEALWDHVTMDPEELGFRAGQDVEVLDMGDPDWWYGRIDTEEGWFPAIFVRLRAIQTDTTEEVAGKIRDGKLDKEEARQRYSCNNLLSRDEARSNVVKEIIHAETDYVKHLRDVVEGYISEAKMRKNMFPEARLKTLFGNIEEIYELSQKFLKDLLLGFNESDPKQSLLGSCFIKHKKSFVVYSEYCNNHPSSDEELRLLKRDTRYVLFFEGCQLLQDMSPIPLDGFLLTPIQKICKYPLQLRELLKHTRPEHPDYCQVEAALASMQEMALLINERKRKIESLETLTVWQSGISHWTGPDLTESSSELIHSGEMVKINHRGSQQERVFFLFDNQLIYCKKDSLRRDELLYRGRINMRDCTLYTLEDGKDSKLGVTLKNAFRIDVPGVEKPYIIYCRDKTQLERWFEAFSKEQALVTKDRESGFNLVEFRTKMEPLLQNRLKKYEKHKGRKHGNKAINTAIADSRRRGHSGLPRRPVVTTTLPRSHHNSSNQSEKKGRFFWSKKS